MTVLMQVHLETPQAHLYAGVPNKSRICTSATLAG